jgi:hypothetical protein
MLTRYDGATTTNRATRAGRIVIVDHEVSVGDCIAGY